MFSYSILKCFVFSKTWVVEEFKNRNGIKKLIVLRREKRILNEKGNCWESFSMIDYPWHYPGLSFVVLRISTICAFYHSALEFFISYIWTIKNIKFLMHNSHIRLYGRFIGSTLQAHTEVLDVFINTWRIKHNHCSFTMTVFFLNPYILRQYLVP